MNDLELQRLAKKRVAMKMAFGIHLLVYILVNAGLLVASLASGRGWFWGPLLGWGLGLAIHGMVTLLNLKGQGLRARMEADELRRLQKGS